jgi:predicted TIM-barrel fold metal-dependent hydrolase
MIADCHTHIWDVEQHLAGKMRASLEGMLARPERLSVAYGEWAKNMQGVDRAFVFGLRAKFCGIVVPNDVVAGFVANDPSKMVGMMGLDPNEDGMIEEFERARTELKLKGVVLSPDLGSFDPRDGRLKDVYKGAVKHSMPIFIHAGQFPVARAAVKHASPSLLDDVLRTFPDLKVVICHFGRPFIAETLALLVKHPGAHADLAGVINSPWELFNALKLAQEYGVMSKLLFASDYPFTLPRENYVRLQQCGDLATGTRIPPLPAPAVHEIIHRNVFRALGLPLGILRAARGQ